MQPLIAIVGSAEPGRKYVYAIRDVALAPAAAGEIGRELAARGCRIVVFSGGSDYIEHAVVAGYAESADAHPGSIEVAGRYGTDIDFAERTTHPDLFMARPASTSDWEETFYRTLLRTDGVLLIGGGRSTFIAGLIALARRIAIAPIAAFGGEAERVWHRLNVNHEGVPDDEVAALAPPWGPTSAAAVARTLVDQCVRARQRQEADLARNRRAGRRTIAGLLSALALLLLALLTIPIAYAINQGAWQNLATLVAAPLLSSTCGALVRNVYDDSGRWLRATVLGCASGTVAFLLFVAAQLATNPNLLATDGPQRLIFFVLGLGFVGGFTSESIYHKLRDKDVLSDPQS